MIGSFSIAEVPLCTSELLTHYVLELNSSGASMAMRILDLDTKFATNGAMGSLLVKEPNKRTLFESTNSLDIHRSPEKTIYIQSNDDITLVKHMDTYHFVESTSIVEALKVISIIAMSDISHYADQFKEADKIFNIQHEGSLYQLKFTDKNIHIAAICISDINNLTEKLFDALDYSNLAESFKEIGKNVIIDSSTSQIMINFIEKTISFVDMSIVEVNKIIDTDKFIRQGASIYFDKLTSLSNDIVSNIMVIDYTKYVGYNISAICINEAGYKTRLHSIMTMAHAALVGFAKDSTKSIQYRSPSIGFVINYITTSFFSFASYSANMSRSTQKIFFDYYWGIVDEFRTDLTKQIDYTSSVIGSVIKKMEHIFSTAIGNEIPLTLKELQKTFLGTHGHNTPDITRDMYLYVSTSINMYEFIGKDSSKQINDIVISSLDIDKLCKKIFSKLSTIQIEQVKYLNKQVSELSTTQLSIKNKIDKIINEEVMAFVDINSQMHKNFVVNFVHNAFLSASRAYLLAISAIAHSVSSTNKNIAKTFNKTIHNATEFSKDLQKTIIELVLSNAVILKLQKTFLIFEAMSYANPSLRKIMSRYNLFSLNHSTSLHKNIKKIIDEYMLTDLFVIKNIHKEIDDYFTSTEALSKLTNLELHELSLAIKHIDKHVDKELALSVLAIVKRSIFIDRNFVVTMNHLVSSSKNINKTIIDSLHEVITIHNSIDKTLIDSLNSTIKMLKDTHSIVEEQSIANASLIKKFDRLITDSIHVVSDITKNTATRIGGVFSHAVNNLRNINVHIMGIAHNIPFTQRGYLYSVVLAIASISNSSMRKHINKTTSYVSSLIGSMFENEFLHLLLSTAAGHHPVVVKDSVKRLLGSISHVVSFSKVKQVVVLLIAQLGNAVSINKYLEKVVIYSSKLNTLLWVHVREYIAIILSWTENGVTKQEEHPLISVSGVVISHTDITSVGVAPIDTTAVPMNI